MLKKQYNIIHPCDHTVKQPIYTKLGDALLLLYEHNMDYQPASRLVPPEAPDGPALRPTKESPHATSLKR